MTSSADIVREAYRLAEGATLDGAGFRALFTDDGVFSPMFSGVEARGEQIAQLIEDLGDQMTGVHRELLGVHDLGDVVAVELVIHANFRGPMQTPVGTLQHEGVDVAIPCGDFWHLRGDKIARFNCYVEIPVLVQQIGAATG